MERICWPWVNTTSAITWLGSKDKGQGHQWCEGTNTRWVFLGTHYSVYLLSFCLHCHSILIATNFDCYDSVKVTSNVGNPLLHQITLDFMPQGTQSTMPLKWLCVWQLSNCGPMDKFGHLYILFPPIVFKKLWHTSLMQDIDCPCRAGESYLRLVYSH